MAPPEDYEYGKPCPECGHSGWFHETCEAHGVSHFDEDGNVTDFDWNEFDEPLYVECPECNTVLIDEFAKIETIHSENITIKETDDDSGVIVQFDGGTRAISNEELIEMTQSNSPVTVR